MGKGIAAALIGAGVRALLHGAAMFYDLETSVNRVALSLEPDLTEVSTFVTLFAARIDLTAHRLEYVDAGHGIAGIVTVDGAAIQFEAEGLPLGVPSQTPWRAQSVPMSPGDTFVCLSLDPPMLMIR
jgi:serine phosphatase RsbU (regulator of sigma subunit)